MKKWILLCSLLFLPLLAHAKPRFPFPSSPDEVGQNDRDLDQQLRDRTDILTQNTSGQILVGQGMGKDPKWAFTGRVLQVVYSHNATDFTTTNATYQNTNLSATITPSTTTSKILIYASGVIGISGSNKSAFLSLSRDTTELGTAATPGFAQLNGQSIGTFIVAPCAVVFVDSPASVSAITYHVRLRDNDGVTAANFGNGLDQSMILVEIGQ